MKREEFNEIISQILESGKVENQNINNSEIIKNIILDDAVNILMYEKFKSNYETVYGNDLDYFVMKIQDLVYRTNILVNHILIENGIQKEEELYDAIFYYVKNDVINFYDAVNYDEEDIVEMKENYESEEMSIN